MPRKATGKELVVRKALRGGLEPIVVTEAGIEQVRQWRKDGFTYATIASKLGLTRRTLHDVRKRQPEVEEALALGHAENEDELVGALMQRVRGAEDDRDAIIAAMFLLKSRHGYRDQGPLDGAQTVNVQVNNFEAMTTPDIRARVAELLEQRNRILAGTEGTRAGE